MPIWLEKALMEFAQCSLNTPMTAPLLKKRVRHFSITLLESTSEIKVLFNVTNGASELRATIVCDRDNENTANITNGDKVNVTFIGKSGCPFLSITYFYEKYPYIFSIVFIATGLLITFAGLRFFKTMLFILTAFAITGVLLIIIYQLIILKNKPKEYAFWVTLGISGLFGLTGGYFVAKFSTVCFVLAGGFLGAIVGFIVYNAFLASVTQVVSLTHVIHC